MLLYHLWPNRLTGGYVGVDVFFVISGFLIAEHLVREIEQTGSVRLGAFWARRAKRLLPAALLTIVVTAGATLLWAPRALWEQFYGEMIAATLYVQNWKLAGDAVDYLAADNSPSPVQHYWTLSAEEQFYVALPIILLLALLVSRRMRTEFQRTAVTFVTVVLVSSLVWCVVQTGSAPGTAYFSTLTRAWEFLAGVLLALLASRFRPRGRTATVGAAAGLLLVLAAFVAFDDQTTFPGAMVAVPVVGSLVLIAFGRTTFLERAGAFAPVAHVGRVSFSIYLWHFPLIVLLPHVTGHPLTTVDKIGIALASLALATVSTLWIEDKVRFSPRLLGTRRPATVGIVSLAMMSLALVATALPLQAARETSARQAELAAELLADLPECFGAATMVEGSDCAELVHSDAYVSSSSLAGKDANRAGCWTTGGEMTLRSCTLGPQTGYTKHLIAVGDSHNNALIDTYEAIAFQKGWRIDVAGRRGCYWTDAHPVHPSDAIREECAFWRGELAQLIDSLGPIDGIVTTHARSNGRVVAEAGRTFEQTVVEAQVSAWGRRAHPEVPIIALVDNPHLPKRAIDCVTSGTPSPATACAVPRKKALADTDGLAEAAAIDPNARTVDLTDLFCTATVCSPVIGGALVYSDGNHLTDTYARSLSPYLAEGIERALAEG